MAGRPPRTFVGDITNFFFIFFLSLVLTMVLILLLLQSFGVLPQPIVIFSSGIVGLVGVIVSIMGLSSFSALKVARFQIGRSWLTVILIVSILFIEGFTSFLSVSYLSPIQICPLLPYPAFLANSQYITPSELYQKVTCRQPDWSSSLNMQDNNQWNENKNCIFKGSKYEVTVQKSNGGLHGDGVQECFAHVPVFSDFAYQIQMTILNKEISGGGGIIFRAPDTIRETMYRIDLDKNGSYNFYLAGNQHCNHQVVDKSGYFCNAPMAFTGAEKTNTITIIAFGNTVYLFINGDYVDIATNNVSNSGYIGVFTNFYKNPSEVAFSDARVWYL